MMAQSKKCFWQKKNVVAKEQDLQRQILLEVPQAWHSDHTEPSEARRLGGHPS